MNLWDICEKYFAVSSVKEQFQNIDNQTFIDFIEKTFLSPTVIFVI